MSADAARAAYIAAGAIGCLMMLAGGWWTLSGILMLVAGFVLSAAYGGYEEPGYYLVAALALVVMAQFGGANPIRDSDDRDATACAVWDC